MRIVNLQSLALLRPPAHDLEVLVEAIPDRYGAAPIQLVVEEDGHRREWHVELPFEELRQFDQLIGPGVDPRHWVVAPLRRLLEPGQIFLGSDRDTTLSLEILVRVFLAPHELGQILLRRLIRGQRHNLQTLGIGHLLDGVDRWLYAVGSDANVGPNDGPVLQLSHLFDARQEGIGPLDLIRFHHHELAFGEGFQLLHAHVVVDHQGKEVLECCDVAVVLSHFLQIKVAIFRRRELVLQHWKARHGAHQIRRRPQSSKRVPNAALFGQEVISSSLGDELADELIDVQIPQAHRDGHHLRPRFAYLVDHVINRHGRT